MFFRFGTAELYPDIQEFSAILGYEFGKRSVVVSCNPKYREILFDALSLLIEIVT